MEIVLKQEEIQDICRRIAKEIEEKVKDDNRVPLLVGVMKGSLNFMYDLMKYIKIPVYTDFIQISSYTGEKRSNTIRFIKDLSFDCGGRSVVIIEDIIDTGHSMKFLINHIKSHNPKNIYVCALFNKKNAREVEVNIDFEGKVLEKNDFLIGYGLDYSELERNVPYVYSASKEDVAKLDAVLKKDNQ